MSATPGIPFGVIAPGRPAIAEFRCVASSRIVREYLKYFQGIVEATGRPGLHRLYSSVQLELGRKV